MDSAQEPSTDPQLGTNHLKDTPDDQEGIIPSINNHRLEEEIQDDVKADSHLNNESLVSDGRLGESSEDNKENTAENCQATDYSESSKEDKVYDVTSTSLDDGPDSGAHDSSSSAFENGKSGQKGEIISEDTQGTLDSISKATDIKELSEVIPKNVAPVLTNDENLPTIINKTEEVNKGDENKGDREYKEMRTQKNSDEKLPNYEETTSLTTADKNNEHDKIHEKDRCHKEISQEVNQDTMTKSVNSNDTCAEDKNTVSRFLSSPDQNTIQDKDSNNTQDVISYSTDLNTSNFDSPPTSIYSTHSLYPENSGQQECSSSGQPVGNAIDNDLTSGTGKEDTSTENGTSGAISANTTDPFTYLDQPTILMSKIIVPSSPTINITNISRTLSTDKGQQNRAGGIRNLFPTTSSDRASASNERSGSVTNETKDDEDEKEGSTREDGDVVLVTGGSGFLGQHIVKLLHQRAPHVAEIRVLDLVYFEKKLDYELTKRMKSLVGDISNAEFVNKALKGVNSVIHVAGVVSWGTFPDYNGMERVNVKGTLNILNACLKNNVERLVYCSTVDVAVGNKPIRGGTEENTPVPDKFLFPGYPETKYHGERIVMGSGPHKRHDGGTLQTAILRANVLYGELDKYYVTNALRLAKQSMGTVYRIGDGKAMFQQAYVGNTAWAFICADTAMKANPELTREIFYIPDNTPVQNSFNFLVPYLDAHRLKLSDGYLSYALTHSAVAAAELLAKAISPLVKINLPVQSCTIAYINTDLYFRGEKAQKVLNYEPIFSANEARDLSMKFYANLDLEDKPRGWNREQR